MKNNVKIVLLMLALSGGTALTSEPQQKSVNTPVTEPIYVVAPQGSSTNIALKKQPFTDSNPNTETGNNPQQNNKVQPKKDAIYTANEKMLDMWNKAQLKVAKIKSSSVGLLKATLDQFLKLIDKAENFEIAGKKTRNQRFFTHNLNKLTDSKELDEVRDYYSKKFAKAKEILTKTSDPLWQESFSNFENYLLSDAKLQIGNRKTVQMNNSRFTTETGNNNVINQSTISTTNNNTNNETTPVQPKTDTIYTANAKMLDIWNKAQKEVDLTLQNIAGEITPADILKATIDKFITLFIAANDFEISGTKTARQDLFTSNLSKLKDLKELDKVRDHYSEKFAEEKKSLERVVKNAALWKDILSNLENYLFKNAPLWKDSLSNFEDYLFGKELQIGESPKETVRMTVHLTKPRSFSQLLWANKVKIIAAGACLTIGALYYFGYKPHKTAFNGYYSLLALLPGFKASANIAFQTGMNKTLTAWEKTKPGFIEAVQWGKNLFAEPQPLNTTINLVP